MPPDSSDTPAIERALLGFLRERPRHGYAIHEELSDPDGLWMVWRIGKSRLYAMLGRLEARGYIDPTMEPQEGRPPRKVYRLTDAGREAFLTWVQRPVQHGRRFRTHFLARLFFARREGAGTVETLIERQRGLCQAWLDEQEADVRQAEQPFRRLVPRYRAGQIRAMLDWLDDCEAALTSALPA